MIKPTATITYIKNRNDKDIGNYTAKHLIDSKYGIEITG